MYLDLTYLEQFLPEMIFIELSELSQAEMTEVREENTTPEKWVVFDINSNSF